MRGLLVTLVLLAPLTAAAADCVVLLHGMARTARSMQSMAGALREAGYVVANEGYPSRRHRIEELAPLAVEAGLRACERDGADGRVHFVTHSLGGILLRQYTRDQSIDHLGRTVMLAPPNQGSRAADRWRRVPGFGWLNGPAGYQLGTGDDSVPRALGQPDFEFAVIAGDRSIDPLTSLLLPNPDDGRVSVSETWLDGASAHRVIHASHAFIMRDREAVALTLEFLEHGRFGSSEE